MGATGHNNTTDLSSPVQVGSLTNWHTVAADTWGWHAIKTDGTLWGVGYSAEGGIGDGATTTRSSPVQIGSETSWKPFNSGGVHASSGQFSGILGA